MRRANREIGHLDLREGRLARIAGDSRNSRSPLRRSRPRPHLSGVGPPRTARSRRLALSVAQHIVAGAAAAFVGAGHSRYLSCFLTAGPEPAWSTGGYRFRCRGGLTLIPHLACGTGRRLVPDRGGCGSRCALDRLSGLLGGVVRLAAAWCAAARAFSAAVCRVIGPGLLAAPLRRGAQGAYQRRIPGWSAAVAVSGPRRGGCPRRLALRSAPCGRSR